MNAQVRKKLVVLEEGDRISRSLETQAVARGWEVVTYPDVTGLLVMARMLQPEAIVLESSLRGSGSVMAVKSFTRNVDLAATPIIAMMTRGATTAAQLLEAGVQACLPEGTDARTLLDAIEQNQPESLDFTQAPAEVIADRGRLAAVAETKAVDSPPDAAFDRLTQLATRLLMAPISLATFVTDSRQFFKSQIGMGEPWATRRETPLSHSFCQWVVASNDALVVDDATAHRVLRDNRAVKELNVVAYAGAPLTGAGGHPVGAMCAIDTKPRAWTADDLKTLQDLAIVASAQSHWTPTRAREAIEAASRMLRRYGPRLRDSEREALLAIVEEQALRMAPRDA